MTTTRSVSFRASRSINDVVTNSVELDGSLDGTTVTFFDVHWKKMQKILLSLPLMV